MPKVEDYKSLAKKAVALASDVIAWTIHTATIEKQYGIKDQLQRSALSVPSNIAEGVDRETDKELARYVYIARGSLTELKTQLLVLVQANLMDIGQYETYLVQIVEVHKMLNGLLKSLKI